MYRSKQMQLLCRGCGKVIANAKNSNKWFYYGELLEAKHFRPTKDYFAQKMSSGDLFMCKDCYFQ